MTGMLFKAVMLACCVLAVHDVQAQTLHAILIGDTTDPSIGAGIRENLKKESFFLDTIQNTAGVAVKRYVVSADSPATDEAPAGFNCKSILQTVRSISPGKDDAILFFYSGHGFRRSSSQTKFPEFDCRRSNDPEQADLSTVTTMLLSKNARLVIAIADTCNVPLQAEFASPAEAGAGDVSMRIAGLKRLFLLSRGMLTMSGSVPGEYSWYYDSGPSAGGFFTNQLLGVIDQQSYSKGDQVRWDGIAEAAKQPIFIPTNPFQQQTPQSASLNLDVVK